MKNAAWKTAVPFWYRETRLQSYQKAYRIVDDRESYTPMEKSIMTSCVCTVGTKYADVAAQLFTSKVCLFFQCFFSCYIFGGNWVVSVRACVRACQRRRMLRLGFGGFFWGGGVWAFLFFITILFCLWVI